MAKISDIAKALGLSNATISKALNGSPEIPQATVDRVKECARELGYVPSHFARTLKMHRSFSIGVLSVAGRKKQMQGLSLQVEEENGIQSERKGSTPEQRL